MHLCFLSILLALSIFVRNGESVPVQGSLTQKKASLNRSESLRTKFLQDVRTKEDTSRFSKEERGKIEHIYERRPDTPRRARVHPDQQEKYSLLRQQEQTFGRIGKIGKETVKDATGKDKVTVHIGGGLSGQFSKHAGQEADKLVRPQSPVKAGNRKH